MSLIKNKRKRNSLILGSIIITAVLTILLILEANKFIIKYNGEIRTHNEFLLSRFKDWSFNGTVSRPASGDLIEIRGVSYNTPSFISSPLPLNIYEVDSIKPIMYAIKANDETLFKDICRGDSVIKFADSPQIFIG